MMPPSGMTPDDPDMPNPALINPVILPGAFLTKADENAVVASHRMIICNFFPLSVPSPCSTACV